MFLKIILVMCVVTIPTLIGLNKAKNYAKRESVLRDSITFFKRLQTEIEYNLTNLPNAIEEARQDLTEEIKYVLGNISMAILDGSYSDILVVNLVDSLTFLQPYDKQVITKGITSLGKSDVTSQINIISCAVANLIELVPEAKEEKVRNSKLYRTVGLVAGLMLAIIVI